MQMVKRRWLSYILRWSVHQVASQLPGLTETKSLRISCDYGPCSALQTSLTCFSNRVLFAVRSFCLRINIEPCALSDDRLLGRNMWLPCHEYKQPRRISINERASSPVMLRRDSVSRHAVGSREIYRNPLVGFNGNLKYTTFMRTSLFHVVM